MSAGRGGDRAATHYGGARWDGGNRADTARPPSPVHHREGPHGLAASLRPQQARQGRGSDRQMETVIGDDLRSRLDERRVTEVDVAVHVLNRMLELGRPNYVRIA